MSFQAYPNFDEYFAIGSGFSRSELVADANYLGELLSHAEQPKGLTLEAIYNLKSAPEVVIELPKGQVFEMRYRPGHNQLHVAFHFDYAIYTVPEWLRSIIADITAAGANDLNREQHQAKVRAQYKAELQHKQNMVATGRAEHIDEL